MRLRKNKSIILLIMILILLILIVFETNTIALSRYGSRGAEVSQIQTKLKRWGYYNGNVDGIYGSQTLSAVKKFQKKNGLAVDGIAGEKTLKAMGIMNSSGGSGSTSSSNSSNLNLLSRVVYSEARGEPYSGQVAVAAVVLNRVKSSSFPNPFISCC